jgi:hypothetical protein
MAIRLVVYDPPAPGFPHLAVVLENDPVTLVLHAEVCRDAADADARLVELGGLLESEGLPGLAQRRGRRPL